MHQNPEPVTGTRPAGLARPDRGPDAGQAAGVILAFDPVASTLRALLDSADITAMRTAAVAAVAARQNAVKTRRRFVTCWKRVLC
jgi:ornithine cyclodeaminase/alanine dehydrogenase-like protein (mu-crystallin family)